MEEIRSQKAVTSSWYPLSWLRQMMVLAESLMYLMYNRAVYTGEETVTNTGCGILKYIKAE